jgi:long-chain fatty acid transport protein
MRKFNFLLWVIFFFSSAISWGYELVSPGGKAEAMGGAFIGASDDWSAIYWNPAGLFQLLDKEVGLEGVYVLLRFWDGDSVSNKEGVFRELIGNEPSSFERKDVDQKLFTPSIGIVLPVKGVTFGFGFFKRMCEDLRWENKGGDLYGKVNRKLDIWNASAGFSLHIAPVVFMGAAVNILRGEYELLASKKWESYEFNYQLGKGFGTGFEVCGGLLYQPMQKFSVGMVYRGGGIINIRGKATASSTFPSSTKEKTDYIRRIYLPPTYGVGVALRYIPNTTITMDWLRIRWEVWQNDYEFTDKDLILLKSPTQQEKDLGLKWADRWSVGFEKRVSEKWKVMFGFFYSQSPKGRIDLVDGVIEMDRVGFSGGFGYKKAESWEFGVSYQLSKGSLRKQGTFYQKRVSIPRFFFNVYFF